MKWMFNPTENWMVNVDQIVHIRKNTRTSLLEVITIDNYCHHIEGMELDELLSLMRSSKDDFIIIPSATNKEAEENKPTTLPCSSVENTTSDVKIRDLVDWTVNGVSFDGLKTCVCNCKRKFTIDDFLTAVFNSCDHKSGSIEIVNTRYTVSSVIADRVILLTFDKTQADSKSQAYQISSRSMYCPNNIDLLNTEVLDIKCVGSCLGRYDYTLYIGV